MIDHGHQLAGEVAVRIAAQRLYDAECALHIAHQTHVDPWIAAANDKLHEADIEYQHAVAESGSSLNRAS
ncbi:hypothetical protein SAMN05892883_4242 [Jatrophihabitans sp. GAS493]|uniref:hypothetical protein n=1 Tax=Jatrophihabitans sp. GAS493 TaxID=1907575 RepID=UPI000BB850AD|nr:hypothetical protein [Jatrophihabitans sp. GAS493]SOD75041.1 hypothetical protein SAMN05892883_4242 [Jatrophihabitans sp. GAS493]